MVGDTFACHAPWYYLNVKSGRIAEGSIVNQSPTYAASAPAEASLSEMWKINRVQGDKYSIRPMSKLDMGLHVTGTNVDIYGIGTTDSISAIPESALWTIEWQSTGYVFKKNGDASGTLQIRNASTIAGDPAAANNYVDNTNCRWTLSKIASPPSGVYLYDTKRNKIGVSVARYIAPGEIRTLSDMSIQCISYSPTSNAQSAVWESGEKAAGVVSTTGKVEGAYPTSGNKITITAKQSIGGNIYTATYNLIVTEIPNRVFYLRNKTSLEFLSYSGSSSSGSDEIGLTTFSVDSDQMWRFTHLGDGTYTIYNIGSSKYLAINNDSASVGAAVVLKAEDVTEKMKWKISISSTYAYKLLPVTGSADNIVLAIDDANDDRVIQYSYTDDDEFSDEWHICQTLEMGFSTDNYTDGCDSGERAAYRYAGKFYNGLIASANSSFIGKTHHYNKGNVRTASKNDFAEYGAIAKYIDFMVYIGHGNPAKDSRGNYIHYNCAPDGTYHSSHSDTSYNEDDFNLYTSDLKLGSSSANLRWVWFYTCRFFKTEDNIYVDEDDLKRLMNGAHIAIGYETAAMLCDDMVIQLSELLESGKSFYEAYPKALQDGEMLHADRDHIVHFVYVEAAKNETIYTPKYTYEYDTSDVRVINFKGDVKR